MADSDEVTVLKLQVLQLNNQVIALARGLNQMERRLKNNQEVAQKSYTAFSDASSELTKKVNSMPSLIKKTVNSKAAQLGKIQKDTVEIVELFDEKTRDFIGKRIKANA